MAATATLRTRSRSLGGPVVRRHPLPARGLLFSSIGHAVVLGSLIAAAVLWRPEPTRTYIVNLTPSVPALGSPTGKSATVTRPAPAPRAEPSTPPARTTATEVPRETAPKPTRAAAPDLPARPVASRSARPSPPPELPVRAAARAADMPARTQPRETPRSGQKELPALSASASLPSSSPRAGAAQREAGPPPPPTPLGRPTGAPQGVGAAASVEGDFPYQWYLTAVQRKVYEQWSHPLSALQGQKAVIVFEIARSGEVTRARVEKTSGDATYDLAALRAVSAANPLPPLPAEFKGSVIRVHFGFEFSGRG